MSEVDCDQRNLCAPQVCEEGACVVLFERECESSDPCVESRCEPETGLCLKEYKTEDADGDGYRAPLAGFLPGEEGSCGDDCNDNSPFAYSGAAEVCDGIDNDCDGVIDNQITLLSELTLSQPQVMTPTGQSSSSGKSLSSVSGGFVFGLWGKEVEATSLIQAFDASGTTIFGPVNTTAVNAASFGASVATADNIVGAVWSDARVDDNYEVYFSRFNLAGEKLSEDLRLSNSDDFSIHGQLASDGDSFYVVHDDRGNFGDGGYARVWGAIISREGELLDSEVPLLNSLDSTEYPQVAVSAERLGVVATRLRYNGTAYQSEIVFQSFSNRFGDGSELISLEAVDGHRAKIVPVPEGFLVAWTRFGTFPGDSIWGSLISPQGEVLVAATRLTEGAEFARGHSMVSLGDRFLLIWSDTLEGNYEVYAKVLDFNFTTIEERFRLTEDSADSLVGAAALAEDGSLGIVFDDWRSNRREAYFLSLSCGSDAREVV
ncbi:MAG: putative metal-binding motif-containing protein, partial [Polyangiaceae bacterium]|nr:putative metal-binding motif-containing protein [Polyangiaceae bacterium]